MGKKSTARTRTEKMMRRQRGNAEKPTENIVRPKGEAIKNFLNPGKADPRRVSVLFVLFFVALCIFLYLSAINAAEPASSTVKSIPKVTKIGLSKVYFPANPQKNLIRLQTALTRISQQVPAELKNSSSVMPGKTVKEAIQNFANSGELNQEFAMITQALAEISQNSLNITIISDVPLSKDPQKISAANQKIMEQIRASSAQVIFTDGFKGAVTWENLYHDALALTYRGSLSGFIGFDEFAREYSKINRKWIPEILDGQVYQLIGVDFGEYRKAMNQISKLQIPGINIDKASFRGFMWYDQVILSRVILEMKKQKVNRAVLVINNNQNIVNLAKTFKIDSI